MELQNETVLFGIVAVLGLSIYVFGVVYVEPTAIGGGTGATEYFEPFRATGGSLLIAAIVGWTATKIQRNHH